MEFYLKTVANPRFESQNIWTSSFPTSGRAHNAEAAGFKHVEKFALYVRASFIRHAGIFICVVFNANIRRARLVQADPDNPSVFNAKKNFKNETKKCLYGEKMDNSNVLVSLVKRLPRTVQFVHQMQEKIVKTKNPFQAYEVLCEPQGKGRWSYLFFILDNYLLTHGELVKQIVEEVLRTWSRAPLWKKIVWSIDKKAVLKQRLRAAYNPVVAPHLYSKSITLAHLAAAKMDSKGHAYHIINLLLKYGFPVHARTSAGETVPEYLFLDRTKYGVMGLRKENLEWVLNTLSLFNLHGFNKFERVAEMFVRNYLKKERSEEIETVRQHFLSIGFYIRRYWGEQWMKESSARIQSNSGKGC